MNRSIIKGALALIALTTIGIAGCTNTQYAHFQALGSDGRITCYSGGRLIFDDFSSGKIMNAHGSDGYEFLSRTTGRLMQVSGTCVVDYGSPASATWHATLPGDPAPSTASVVSVPSE